VLSSFILRLFLPSLTCLLLPSFIFASVFVIELIPSESHLLCVDCSHSPSFPLQFSERSVLVVGFLPNSRLYQRHVRGERTILLSSLSSLSLRHSSPEAHCVPRNPGEAREAVQLGPHRFMSSLPGCSRKASIRTSHRCSGIHRHLVPIVISLTLLISVGEEHHPSTLEGGPSSC
jgi:hypothetical protein